MKKISNLLLVLLIPIFGSAIISCDNEDEVEYVTYEQLPNQAKIFLSQFFPGVKILSTHRDTDEYEVVLNGGTEIDFTLSGDWKNVDGAPGQTIPNGFYPSEIDLYIVSNYAGTGINEISKTHYGYEVELVNNLDLMFNTNGEFIGLK